MGQYTVWIENLNIVKMLILLKLIYRFNISPIKIPVGYFAKIDKLILKFKKKIKENRIDKIISKKNYVRRLTLLDRLSRNRNPESIVLAEG